MRSIFVATLFALFALGASAAETESESVRNAQDAAQTWLAAADAGQFGATWEQAAPAFQGAVKKADWEQAFAGLRAPFGKVVKRTLISASYSNQLPGAPAGEYVVIRFSTRFDNNAEVVELVTPMRDKDGKWKVSGYFVQ